MMGNSASIRKSLEAWDLRSGRVSACGKKCPELRIARERLSHSRVGQALSPANRFFHSFASHEKATHATEPRLFRAVFGKDAIAEDGSQGRRPAMMVTSRRC